VRVGAAEQEGEVEEPQSRELIAIYCSPRMRIFTCGGNEIRIRFWFCIVLQWARGSVVVKALCYKPECPGFKTAWNEVFSLPNSSGRNRPWVSLSL
jgi:hypothetical protein